MSEALKNQMTQAIALHSGDSEEGVTANEVFSVLSDKSARSEREQEALGEWVTDVSEGTVRNRLDDLVDEGVIEVEEGAGKYGANLYHVPSENFTQTTDASTEESNEAAESDDVSIAPVVRDYDFTEQIPDIQDLPEYVETSTELKELRARIRHDKSEGITSAIAYGPTGTGKTLAAQTLAAEQNAVVFYIQGKYALTESDIVGRAIANADGGIMWVDSVLPKAFLASQDHEVFIIFDEATRADGKAKDALYSALDHRGFIQLDGPRGGERIEANTDNITLFATGNKGRKYNTNQQDNAEKRRYQWAFEFDHLGRTKPDEEARIIKEHAEGSVDADVTFSKDVARKMVDAANDVRKYVDPTENTNHDYSVRIEEGVPLAAMKQWAATAVQYKLDGLENAFPDGILSKAAERTVSTLMYEEDAMGGGKAQSPRFVVQEILKSNIDSVEIEGLNHSDATDTDSDHFKCPDCGWSAFKQSAPTITKDTRACPNPSCGSTVEEVSAP